VSSTIAASTTLSMLGHNVQFKWRVAFALFCWVQLLVRVMSLCAFVVLTIELCWKDNAKICSADTFSSQLLVVGWLFWSFVFSMLFHVVHLQVFDRCSLSCT
jgi:hypothetical protein